MAQVDAVRVIDFTDGEPTIGMGFNSDTLLFPGTALNFVRTEPDPHEDGQIVSAQAVIVNSHEELQESIGTSISVSGRYGLASASAKVDFSKSTGFNSTSTFVLAKASVINPIFRGVNFALTDDANKLLKANNLDGFKTAFGDSFVRGIKTGGEFFAVFRLTSLKTTSQQELAASLTAEVNGLVASGSFNASFQDKSRDEQDRMEVEVNFYQAAGQRVSADVTLDVASILDRLRTFPTVAADHPMPFKVEIATYNTIPIPIPSAEEHDDFLIALKADDAKKLDYIRRKNDVDFALQHSEFFDDLPDPKELQSQSEIYVRLLNEVMAHAVRLAKGEISPPQVFDPATVNLAEPIPIEFKRKGTGLPFGAGDHITLRCLGQISKPDHLFLNGITQNGVVNLVANTAPPFTGTLWEVVRLPDGFGFRCLGSFENQDHVFLDGHAAQDGSLGLAPNTDPPFTGTHWDVSQLSDGSCVFRCLGANAKPGFVFLDGRTTDGSVGLAPTTNDPFTGSHWSPTVVRDTAAS